MSESTKSRNYDMRDTRRMLLGWPSAVGYDRNDPDVLKFYNKDTGRVTDRNSMFSQKKLTDIFIYSMTLGKNEGVPVDYKDRREDRLASINVEYFASQPQYVWMMIATALEETKGDMAVFEKAQTIIDICERYANYGIKKLIGIEDKITSKDPYLGYEELFEKLLKELKEENEMSHM